jgi:hypothetical protein
LQIERRLREHNRSNPDSRVWIIEYDDFNPFLDRFRGRMGARRAADRLLAEWKLWDHMDAILSLGVTGLVDRILDIKPRSGQNRDSIDAINPRALDRYQARDLLLLAACYDQSTAQTTKGRWRRLRRKLRFRTWRSKWDIALGLVITAAIAGLMAYFDAWDWLKTPWPYLAAAAGWAPRVARCARRLWLAWGIKRNVRVGNLAIRPLRQSLMNFTSAELSGQPLPNKQRTDDRYELLSKFQGIAATLGYTGILVLVDRVDEPHLITGSVEKMRALLWPLLDNKLLKHPGLGFKLLLPIELSQFLERESRDFVQRARLDKQNLIPSLEWTGEALYDVASARIRACALPDRKPTLQDLFDAGVSDRRLMEAFRSLRVPRHLFKFMHRLLVAHSNAYTDDAPTWKISPERFESVLALYSRDQDAFDRGLRAG